jgi:hypothetical protein
MLLLLLLGALLLLAVMLRPATLLGARLSYCCISRQLLRLPHIERRTHQQQLRSLHLTLKHVLALPQSILLLLQLTRLLRPATNHCTHASSQRQRHAKLLQRCRHSAWAAQPYGTYNSGKQCWVTCPQCCCSCSCQLLS